MKAMVLAAGLGTRLRPLTEIVPKPLVPIANRPVLDHQLHMLAQLGITEVMINVHHLSDLIRAHVGDGLRYGLRAHFSVETELLGTGGALSSVQDFFDGEEAFLVVNADIYHAIDLRAVIGWHAACGSVATMVTRAHPGDLRFGLVEVDAHHRVRRVPNMPVQGGLQAHMFTGLHVLSPAIFAYLDPEERGCILRTGYRRMIEAGLPIAAYDVGTASSIDIGTVQDYIFANIQAVRGRAPSLSSQDPAVHPPVMIGEGATLEHGVQVGPDVVVGDGAHIATGAVVRRAVIWPGARVSGREIIEEAVVYGSGSIVRPE